MHKKLLLISFLFFLLALPSSLSASYIGTANGVYKFESTILKAEMYNSTTSAWVVLWDYTSNTTNANIPIVDIGSATSVSEQMGTYSSGTNVPVGTYTQMRVTMKNTVKLRGWALVSGTYYYTDNTVVMWQTSSNGSTVPSDATCTEITLSPPEGSGMPETMTDTVTITGGLNVTDGGSVGVSIVFPMESLFTAQSFSGPGDVTGYMITPADNAPTVTPQ